MVHINQTKLQGTGEYVAVKFIRQRATRAVSMSSKIQSKGGKMLLAERERNEKKTIAKKT